MRELYRLLWDTTAIISPSPSVPDNVAWWEPWSRQGAGLSYLCGRCGDGPPPARTNIEHNRLAMFLDATAVDIAALEVA